VGGIFARIGLLRAVAMIACGVFASGAAAAALNEAAFGPKAQHFSLANGMKVVVIPDHRAPVVTHMIWYQVGSADEEPGRSGLAHFLEHLMFKGTEKIPPGEFSKIVAANGGQDNAFTSQDATAYFQRVSKENLSLVMEIESDRMANLMLDEKSVLTERDVILEERRSRVENDPASILNEQMMAALYQSHPYRIPVIGWRHEIAELDREDALAFYKRHYAPNNAILIVAGDVTDKEVKALAEKTYAKIAKNGAIGQRQRPKEPPHRAPVRLILEDPRAGKATLQRFYIVPSYTSAKPGEAEALDLLLKIAASGTTSRLYKAVVVEQKKAASASGWYSGSGLDSGRLGLAAIAADGTSLEEVEAAIDAVIADIVKNGVTQKELERARDSYIADFVYGSDSQSRLAQRYGWGLIAGQSVEDKESHTRRREPYRQDIFRYQSVSDRLLDSNEEKSDQGGR
jgi:zinc protease